MDAENDLSSNSIRCGWSSAFTHRTVDPTFTVMFAGWKEFFTMVMVLSDTEAVRVGVKTGDGRVVVTGCEGIGGATVGVTTGCAGGDSEHPQVRRGRRAMRRSTGMGLIDAGRSFPYNNIMA